ncbi:MULTISPECIES: YidC/Oxa1 family membrane protein insertase [unclassified Parvimonas]|uniref:YidC/Oxa1 family membrane protein insertase n=1 Tax=unclassified Parvimonas TaxID=1151464 RepID=UPI0039E29E77
MAFLRNLMGSVLKFIYEGVASILPNEPSSISYLAISIIIISIIFKVVLFPIFLSSIKNQKIQAKFAKEQQKIREKYKHDPQAMNLKLMEFNKEHGIKQLGGCLPMIFNFILVIAMFAVMREPLLYIFGDANANVMKNFLWIKDLSVPDPLIYGLPLINAITQYIYFDLSNRDQKDNPAAKSMETMKYIFPLVIFISAKSFSAGLALYWAMTNIVEILLRLALTAYENRKMSKE